MTRNLGYLVAETGPCCHCYRDAGDHDVNGLCVMETLDAGAHVPQSYYRGKKQHAFVDLDDPMPSLRPVAVAP